MSLDELEILTVANPPFHLSSIRSHLLGNLRILLTRLFDANVIGEAWINGSFLTEKIDPEDIDVVFRFPISEYEDSVEQKRSAIEWSVHRDRHDDLCCDTYVFHEYPGTDPLHAHTEERRKYWLNQFGTDREGVLKGIAVIRTVSEELLPWTS